MLIDGTGRTRVPSGGTNVLIGDAVQVTGQEPTGGNDTLISAPHTNDSMWGDFQSVSGGPPHFGNDTFVFGPHNGNDIINDFQLPDPQTSFAGDIIEIDSKKPMTFADLNIQPLDTNNDGILDSSVIQFDPHDSVTVLGIPNLTDHPEVFHFVLI